MSSPSQPQRFRTEEAANYVGVSSSYFSKLRVFGGGPAYHKLGRRVVYDRADLDAWLAGRKRTNTSEGAIGGSHLHPSKKPTTST